MPIQVGCELQDGNDGVGAVVLMDIGFDKLREHLCGQPTAVIAP